MPYIPSHTLDNSQALDQPSADARYTHPLERNQGRIPMVFQVTSPLDNLVNLLPHALVLHANPTSFSESYSKKIERIQTRGGWIEQHWGDDLTDISASGSTGAFISLKGKSSVGLQPSPLGTGLSNVNRHNTIAWDRYRDLLDLFHNNGSLYDRYNNIVLQGKISLMYDRGTYIGTFRSFEVEETADSPWVFNLSWQFKVEYSILKVPQRTPPQATR